MTLEDLGRRAVACKHWRWMDGMLIQPLNSRTAVIEEEYIHDRGWSAKRRKWDDLHPDLSDPATLGCLLALVREAWTRDPDVNHWVSYAVPVFDGLETWRVGCIVDGAKMFAVCNLATMTLVEGKTEAEALVAALEAAP
ncbi:MAG: hypothetical protein EBR88_03505 [Betaproteobacteria bacterium]|nr:hypothetical protein [Betaproteobacteria bacterium]